MGLFDFWKRSKPMPSVVQQKNVYPVSMVRAYATLRDRLYQDLSLTNTLADADIRMAISDYRAAARMLFQNNAYAKRYADTVGMNIVGQNGFTLKVQAQDYVPSTQTYNLDKLANNKIEEAWYQWNKSENCTPKGDISFRELCQVIVKTVAIDGEVFIKLLRGNGKYGLQLQLVPSELVDYSYNEKLRNGNIVIMGVELDPVGTPVAYYVSDVNPIASIYGASTAIKRTRIPASQMMHLYLREYSNQTRGMSWYSPVIKPLKMLDGFEEAALVNARASACKMGFIERTSDSQKYTASDKDADGNRYLDFSPGLIEELDYGQSFTGYDPKFPESAYADYVKSLLKKIASGLGISYSTLTGDLTEVNYSSIRAGIVEERNMWKNRQRWFAEMFLEKLYSEWLKLALTTGQIRLPIEKLEKFNSPIFIGRSYEWVDPQNDVEASVTAIKNGLTTYTQVLAEQGKDVEEQFALISKEHELMKQYGLEFGDSGEITTEEDNEDGNEQRSDDNTSV